MNDLSTDLKNFDIPTFIEKFKALFETIFDTIYEDIFCIIFNYIKKFVIKLAIVIAIELIKEQLGKRAKILESFSPIKVTETLKTLV